MHDSVRRTCRAEVQHQQVSKLLGQVFGEPQKWPVPAHGLHRLAECQEQGDCQFTEPGQFEWQAVAGLAHQQRTR